MNFPEGKNPFRGFAKATEAVKCIEQMLNETLVKDWKGKIQKISEAREGHTDVARRLVLQSATQTLEQCIRDTGLLIEALGLAAQQLDEDPNSFRDHN